MSHLLIVEARFYDKLADELLEGALHHLGKAAGGFAEESVACIHDFLERILIAVLGRGRCGPVMAPWKPMIACAAPRRSARRS